MIVELSPTPSLNPILWWGVKFSDTLTITFLSHTNISLRLFIYFLLFMRFQPKRLEYRHRVNKRFTNVRFKNYT